MDRIKWPVIAGFIAGIVQLTRITPTTFAFDKPVHTAILLTLTLAATIFVASTVVLRWSDSLERKQGSQDYVALPLEDRGRSLSLGDSALGATETTYRAPSLPKLKTSFLIFVVAGTLRVLLWREILANWQCTRSDWTPLLPLACTVLDVRLRGRHDQEPSHEDDVDSSIYDAFIHNTLKSKYSHLLATSFIGFGGMLAMSLTGNPASTYICAISAHHHWLIPFQQLVGFLLEVAIVISLGQLLYQQDRRKVNSSALKLQSMGWALLVLSTALMIIVLLWCIFVSDDRQWILTVDNLYLRSTMKLNLLFVVTAACGLIMVHRYGAIITLIVATFVAITSTTTAYAWSISHPFPPVPIGLRLVAIYLTIFGVAFYFHVESASVQRSSHATQHVLFHKVPVWFNLCLIGLLCLRLTLWASQTNTVHYHPIDLLLYEAQLSHDLYRNSSTIGHTLADAAERYREKYNQHPPPGFQHWYKYATARDSIIIDAFDSIHKDMLPFRALSPEEIRQRTWALISNPWHEAGGIIIRNGEASISPHVPGTHAWMLQGVIDMISNFVKWLPDMDVAFNLNDECRVAMPFEQAAKLQGRAEDDLQSRPINDYSERRAETWKLIPDPANEEQIMEDLSFARTFYSYGSVGCHPTSSARADRIWDVSSLCTDCTAPHSLGAFLANWTLAADICHQPDLANLHGFYLSPAAFKGSHELLPIFSQSKVHGFSDIMYPSPWNYLGKASYTPSEDHPDVPFEDKENTLFWRGGTTEGVSSGHDQWKGMTRQRFTHFTHTAAGSSIQHPLLLPDEERDGKQSLTYQSAPSHQVSNLLSADVQIVDKIDRCGGRDCPNQVAEFEPFAEGVDFQNQWKYKYLLDLDGAGFSGRFLPFLQSRSLPFKAALFREWWDDRVTPWHHFVPLDLRGHGFWATLLYFAGADGKLNGKDLQIEGHQHEAEFVAQRGRKWANLVLRKEDMEIYMFRLLLEWGRMTDDRRDEIGYDG